MKLNLTDIGILIAERQFEGRKNGKTFIITVRIGKPFPDQKDEGCWYCPYSIEVDDTKRLFYGAGVDSLQALRIALSMIETELVSKFAHLNLTWMGEQHLGLSNKP